MTTGCLSNFSLSDAATGGGAILGAAASVATGLPIAAVVTSTAVGATAGSALVGQKESTLDVLEALPEEERASALKNQNMWEAIEGLGWYAMLGILGFFLIPMLIGYVLPNGKQRKMERDMFNDPKYKK